MSRKFRGGRGHSSAQGRDEKENSALGEEGADWTRISEGGEQNHGFWVSLLSLSCLPKKDEKNGYNQST